MIRYKVRHFLALSVLIAIPALIGAAPALLDLMTRVENLEADSLLTAAIIETLQEQNQSLEGDLASLQAESDSELLVIDANGIQIGTGSILSGGWMEIPFDVDGLPPFVLQAAKDRIVGSATQLLFESNDCSGQPLMNQWVSGSTPLLLSYVFVHSSRSDLPIYFSDQNAPPQSKTIHSRIDHDNQDCSTGLNIFNPWLAPAINTGIYPMTDYTPPFRVVTRREFLAIQGGN